MSDRAFLLGLHVLSYGEPWSEVARVAALADAAGYDLLLGADHLYATGSDPYEPFFEGWLTLACWAQLTSRVRIGLLVGANPLRHPAVVAKMITTLDHQSGGRAILGLGAAWHDRELSDHGIDPGSGIGERLGWLDESLTIVRALLDGSTVDHDSDRYRMVGVKHEPRPLQDHVPVLVGAEGERLGLRIVACHADLWQWWAPMVSTDAFERKSAVLGGHCRDLGRDPESIARLPGAKVILRSDASASERAFQVAADAHGWSGVLSDEVRRSAWLTTPAAAIEALTRYRRAGADGFIVQAFGPYDDETISRFADQVRPAVGG